MQGFSARPLRPVVVPGSIAAVALALMPVHLESATPERGIVSAYAPAVVAADEAAGATAELSAGTHTEAIGPEAIGPEAIGHSAPAAPKGAVARALEKLDISRASPTALANAPSGRAAGLLTAYAEAIEAGVSAEEADRLLADRSGGRRAPDVAIARQSLLEARGFTARTEMVRLPERKPRRDEAPAVAATDLR